MVEEATVPQIHCYVSEEEAETLRRKAKAQGLSLSRYLASIAKKDASSGWPEGWFERTFGCIDDPTFERPPQGELEEIQPLDLP